MDMSYEVLFVVLSMVSAITYQEKKTMRLSAISMISSCETEYGITKLKLLAAIESKNPDALNSCFYSCFFKNSGVMNNNGFFDPDSAIEISKKYTTDIQYLDKILKICKECSSVNDKSIEDGAKGCDRARMLVYCILDKKYALFSAS